MLEFVTWCHRSLWQSPFQVEQQPKFLADRRLQAVNRADNPDGSV